VRSPTPSPAAAREPNGFVALVAHPIRWRLLEELGQSDRAVRELTRLVGEPQNLVSYHLRQLRDGGLVSARRSTADARDSYSAIDLVRCEEQLRAAGRALHPGLRLVREPSQPSARSRAPRRVLFLCTGNSARSQIAEALLVQASGGAVETASAGSNPKPLHPNAVRVMKQRGVDISHHRSKHLDTFLRQRFDAVITLCDRVREVCPEFPRQPMTAHWSIPDPALEGPSRRASYPAFVRTADELETRIGYLLYRLNTVPNRRLQHGH
jgi:protein-tyrosine-phosphatase/DNA-binding transcriptional ArsR family regulator